MPEHDKSERFIGGETSITPSSDAAIAATLAGIRREIQGLPDPEIVIDGESLTPKTTVGPSEELSGDGPEAPVIRPVQFAPNNSALANRIFSRRQAQLKKAA